MNQELYQKYVEILKSEACSGVGLYRTDRSGVCSSGGEKGAGTVSGESGSVMQRKYY